MAQRKTLSELQVSVLRWIGGGCPEGVMVGDAHRISAAALRRRGLVTTSGRGPSWTASITDDGRRYLARCDGPNPPAPRQANGSVVERFVADIVAAGGSTRVPRHHYGLPGSVDYEHRVRQAERHGKVPAGKRLVVHHDRDELLIELVDAPEGTPEAPRPVPVPARLTLPHPAVTAFREASDRVAVSRAELPRAARVLQGIATEAERRGYRVHAPAWMAETGGRRGRTSAGGVLVVEVDGHPCEVSLSEEGVPSGANWERRNGTYVHDPGGFGRWKPPPRSAYEAGATGRLRVSLPTTYSGRQHEWTDRQRWTVEDKLPEVLLEIERRAAEARERQREAERKKAERQRQWEAAMERARARFLDDRRAKALTDQVERWRRAADIRAYCDAVDTAHPDAPATTDWTAWARAYSDRIDPLRQAPVAPPAPEQVTAEDLRPYLGRWSPYGPDR